MKKLIVLIIGLFMMGCVTTGLDKRVDELEKKLTKIELMGAAGAAEANFYPARDFTGGGAGALDKIGSTEDGDVGFVAVQAHATYGNALFVYVLDVDAACGEDDSGVPPKYIQAADGGDECWELTNIYAFNSIAGMKQVAHSGGNDTLTVEEVTNTYLYVTVAAEFELPEIGTLAEVMGNVGMVPLGSSFCVHTVGAIAISIDPHTNNSIMLDGVEDTNGHKITNTSTAGDFICLVACEDNGWCAPTNPSSWTAGGD